MVPHLALILICLYGAQLSSGQSSSSGGSSSGLRNHEFLPPSRPEAPRGTTVSFTIDEELPIGSRIGSLVERLGSSQHSIRYALHEEIASSETGINFIPLTDERLVLLNRTNGLLTVRQRIDREALCRDLSVCCPGAEAIADGTFLPLPGDLDSTGTDAFLTPRIASCSLKMLVMDQRLHADASPYSGAASSSLTSQDQNNLIHVVIYVNDLNDNAPFWSPNKLELEIPEHTAIGRMFQLPEATDPDQGPEHTVQHYQLVATDGPPGKDRYVGAGVSVFDPSARQTASSSSSSDMFSLSHEISERLTTSPYKFTLRLKVNADLDREKQSIYYFLLFAIDGGGPRVGYHGSSSLVQQARQLTGTLSIVVKVTDINDQAPYFLRSQPAIEILENTPIGTQIYTIAANDNDPSDANRLVYRMGSAASAEITRLFSINAQTGAAFVIGEIDYETAPFLSNRDTGHVMSQGYGHATSAKKEVGYLIPVEVSDGAHIAETELRVQIINVNDNAPNISIQSHLQRLTTTGEILIKEDVPEGTLVATISMTDADERGPVPSSLGGQGLVSYLHESAYREALPHCSTTNPFFLIQPLFTGARNHFKLVTARPLDHEIKANLGVTVMCHDSGQPVLSSKQHINVRLEDVNDSPPIFDKSAYYARISEGLPIHTPITQVHATDADTRLFADIRYRLVSSSPAGTPGELANRQVLESAVLLDERTGQLRSGAVYDRELMSSINFTVLAVDCAGGPDWRNTSTESGVCSQVNTATAEVIVLIEDVNDCAPEFDQQSYEFPIAEGQPPKTLGKLENLRESDLPWADEKIFMRELQIEFVCPSSETRIFLVFKRIYSWEAAYCVAS
ncbi:unnamed protein product [Schistocephalus solidus]|uniref:Protocadherin-16 n=1 Tax=Schistocephalus solidus TaxID=70667 RepID=A0A183SQY5_SCHSO|nr:unnamed protein product [Schistocephalus solidus]